MNYRDSSLAAGTALATAGAMADFLYLLLCGVAAVLVSFNAGAASSDEDGFIWIDANTRIKVIKPVSSAAGETKAPEPKKEKKEKPPK